MTNAQRAQKERERQAATVLAAVQYLQANHAYNWKWPGSGEADDSEMRADGTPLPRNCWPGPTAGGKAPQAAQPTHKTERGHNVTKFTPLGPNKWVLLARAARRQLTHIEQSLLGKARGG